MSAAPDPATELILRQGDVLLRAVPAIPDGLRPVERDGGRIVLAYGEVTGHAHAIEAPLEEATLLTSSEQRRFLQLVRDVELRHEEHRTLTLPAGLYEVIQQRVWTDADDDREQQWRYACD